MSIRRSARMGGLATAYSALMLVGVIALAVLSARHPVRFDLTRDQRQSLSSETRRILASIPEGAAPVDVLGVTSYAAGGGNPSEAKRQVEALLDLFAREAPLKVKTHVAFAEAEPALMQQLAIDKTPMLVVRWMPPALAAESGAPSAPPEIRERRTDVMSQDALARAIAECVEGRLRQAYLLAGHGEMRRDETGPTGIGSAAAILQGLNFEPHDLLLAGKADVPADADLLVLAGPEADLLPDEIAALRRYADRGGRFLVVHGPSRTAGAFPALEAWLRSDWAIGSLDGLVADLDAPLAGNQVTLLVRSDKDDLHPIVRGFSKLIEMPATRKLAVDPYPADGVTATVLLQSGAHSWLETDLTTRSPQFDETDLRGPHSLALASVRKPPTLLPPTEARLVALGSRLAISNMFIGEVGNADFLRNVVSWLSGREADIAQRAGSGQDGSVIIEQRQGLIILITTLAVPLIVAVGGVVTWWWRRRL